MHECSKRRWHDSCHSMQNSCIR